MPLKSFDFESDLKTAISREYQHLDVKIKKRDSLHDMLLDYFTVHHKIIQPIPRKVRVSPLLDQKLYNHPKRKQVELICSRLTNGLDVNFFQNKKLFQTNFHDHLLSEWNIYHFHLSTILEPKGKFFKKTNSLLFVYITDQEAILLDTETHGNGVFADEKWLTILDNFFPEVIAPYVDTKIKDIRPELTPMQRQELWSKGYSIGMTKVNEKIIHSPGIGRSLSGHSMMVTKTTNATLRWIYTITEQFTEYGNEICEYFNLDQSAVHFKVQFGNPTLDVVDASSKTWILSFPDIFTITENK